MFGPQEKVTDYAGELIFQNDTLQFINTEEGRVVMTGEEPEYQYHLKDHLGSIRTTFSETHTTEEFVATLESATNDDFLNHNNRSGFAPYNHTPSGTYSQLLNGGYNGQVGLAKSFAVEPGDVFDLEVYAKYEAPASTSADPSTLLAALFSTFSLGAGGTGPESQVAADGFNVFFGGDNIWIDDDMYDPSVPRAYLNYILFDENFIPVDSGFSQVTDAGATAHELLSLHVKVERKGYLYVYLSNEQTVRTNVYFDDFRIVRYTGVVQMDDYYPFGLTYNSFQRETSVKNRWKFQGQEHIDELNLGWDSFKWRNHQPDIGRFFNVDPLAEKYVYNSTYAFSENHVVAHRELEGLEKVWVTSAEFTADKQGKTIYTQGGAQKYEDKNIYNTNFAEAPNGGEYKEVKAQVEASNGKILSIDNYEGGDGVFEEFFDMLFTGDIDNFDYSLKGENTRNGSRLQGNVEGAEFSVEISFDKDIMTVTTNMTGGDENKAYSVKMANGDGKGGEFVIGTLKSGRSQGKNSTTTISIPFTMDRNGNAIFNGKEWLKLQEKSEREPTQQ